MAIDPDGVFSRGDIMRRLAQLERDLRSLQTARRLESAAIGAGGIRVRGGAIIIQDSDGVELIRLSTDGLTLTGELTTVGGGDSAVIGGSLVARDDDGDVFRVDPTVPEIFMRPELIETLSAQVLAARIHDDNVTTGVPLEGTSSTTYTDLTTVGPTVPGVDISPAGKALVILSAALIPGANDGAVMSFEVTGASTRAADDGRALILERGGDFVGATVAAVLPITGLSPGVHQFRAKYRSEFGALAEFDRRGLTVMAF